MEKWKKSGVHLEAVAKSAAQPEKTDGPGANPVLIESSTTPNNTLHEETEKSSGKEKKTEKNPKDEISDVRLENEDQQESGLHEQLRGVIEGEGNSQSKGKALERIARENGMEVKEVQAGKRQDPRRTGKNKGV